MVYYVMLVFGEWNALVGKDAQADLGMFVDPSAMSKQLRQVPDF